MFLRLDNYVSIPTNTHKSKTENTLKELIAGKYANFDEKQKLNADGTCIHVYGC